MGLTSNLAFSHAVELYLGSVKSFTGQSDKPSGGVEDVLLETKQVELGSEEQRASTDALSTSVDALCTIMQAGFQEQRVIMIQLSEDVDEMLIRQGAVFERAASKNILEILAYDGQKIVAHGVKEPTFRVKGEEQSSVYPFLKYIGSPAQQEALRLKIVTAMSSQNYTNWEGETTPLRKFQCDCAVSIAAGIGTAVPPELVSFEVMRAASLENIAKAIAQSCVVPMILKWASRGILRREQELGSICAAVFGPTLQEEKLTRILQKSGKDASAAQKSLDLTRQLLASGECVCCQSSRGCLRDSTSASQFETAIKAILQGVDIPRIPDPSLDGGIEEVFLPYKVVKDMHLGDVDSDTTQRQAQAAMSLLVSLHIVSKLQLGYLHLQQIEEENAF